MHKYTYIYIMYTSDGGVGSQDSKQIEQTHRSALAPCARSSSLIGLEANLAQED